MPTMRWPELYRLNISARNHQIRDVVQNIEYALTIRWISIQTLRAWVSTLEDRDRGNKMSDGTARLLGLASNKHDRAEPRKERKKAW